MYTCLPVGLHISSNKEITFNSHLRLRKRQNKYFRLDSICQIVQWNFISSQNTRISKSFYMLSLKVSVPTVLFYELQMFGCQESVSILSSLAKAAVCSLLLLCICSYLDQEMLYPLWQLWKCWQVDRHAVAL